MESWKGNRTPSNPQEGYYVGLMNACGYRTKDLEKPVSGIVNSFTDVNPGHRAFKELVGYVKEGVWAAGGTPAEFNVPAPCDGMAQGHDGINYSLASRDTMSLEFNSTPRCSIGSIETRITCSTSALPGSGRRSIFTMPAACPESWKKSAPCSIWTP